MLDMVDCAKILVWGKISRLGFQTGLFCPNLFEQVRGRISLRLEHESCR